MLKGQQYWKNNYSYMRKVVFTLALLASICMLSSAQTSLKNERGATVALKTNALYWATTTPNLGLEVRLAPKWTLEAEVGLNPFAPKKEDGSFDKSIKHFRLHPEVRYWLGTENERHQGWGTGVGLSYGYSWVLGKHWNIEATIGAGYLYLESDIYPCTHCGTKREKVKKHYVGPTQAALSAVYVF